MTLYAFRAVPLMFGPDHERAADPTDADYWTVYATEASSDASEGMEYAYADTRDLTNALAWIAAKMDARVDVDVPIGDRVLTVAVEPIPTDWFAADDLLFDVGKAEHEAGVPCGCGEGNPDCPTTYECAGCGRLNDPANPAGPDHADDCAEAA